MFDTTLWHRIEELQRGDDREGWTWLESYRAPLGRYLRSQGVPDADAEDLVQEVFLRLLRSEVLQRADRTRGRFRAWLLGITRNVRREEQARREAARRGGGRQHVPLEDAPEPASEDTPDEEFDREWWRHVLERAMARLAEEHPVQHRALALRFQQERSHEQIVAETGRNLQQVKNDLHRGRKRIAELAKQAIGDYCSSPEEYARELEAFSAWLR